MYGMYDYDELYDKRVKAEERNLDRAKHERNVALAMDVATNLTSMFARSRGARTYIGTNSTAGANKRVMAAEQRLADAMRDFEGHKAAVAFNGWLSGYNDKESQNRHRPGYGRSIPTQTEKEQGGLPPTHFLKRPIVLKPGLIQPKKPMFNLKPFGVKNNK